MIGWFRFKIECNFSVHNLALSIDSKLIEWPPNEEKVYENQWQFIFKISGNNNLNFESMINKKVKCMRIEQSFYIRYYCNYKSNEPTNNYKVSSMGCCKNMNKIVHLYHFKYNISPYNSNNCRYINETYVLLLRKLYQGWDKQIPTNQPAKI